MVPFRLFIPELICRQAKADERVELKHADTGIPFLTVLVPAGDWILGELTDAGELNPMLTMTNTQFRELMDPAQPAAEQYLAESIQVYVPKPNTGAAEVPGAGPV